MPARRSRDARRALGIASALEYAPAYYADTDELIALCKAAARHKGKYITHMRSEGERLLEGIDEAIRISREANIPAEIYHFKAAGKNNWKKMDRGDRPRRGGSAFRIADYRGHVLLHGRCRTADSLHSAVGDGRRARSPCGAGLPTPPAANESSTTSRTRPTGPTSTTTRARPRTSCSSASSTDALKPLQGKNLAQIAREQGKDPVEMLLDLLLEDQSSIGTAYFITAEENIRKLVPLPWISFGSDEASQSPEGVFLKSLPHPRAYGNFARLLGKYVREEKLLTLEAAIRKLSHLPATNLGLDRRGLLQEGYFADVVVFDPATIGDRATYEKPHQYAVGMRHVFVNGVGVLKDGEHTGAKPGKALWGPGKVDR